MTPLLLALDFDGVLHRHFPVVGAADADNAHFAFLPAFEAAVRRCQSIRPIEIAIASTWRNNHTLEALRALFSPDIAALIVGTTPRVGAGTGPGARQAEVEAFVLATGRTAQPWVGVDDFPELYAPGAAVVVCNDGFWTRETDLLMEAVTDPEVFAKTHPVPGPEAEKKLVIVSGVTSGPR